jgi:hypothetical protein
MAVPRKPVCSGYLGMDSYSAGQETTCIYVPETSTRQLFDLILNYLIEM